MSNKNKYFDEMNTAFRNIINSRKGSGTIAELTKDYQDLYGKNIDYAKLEVKTLQEFFILSDQFITSGHNSKNFQVSCIPSVKSAHITKMVARQKNSKKGKVQKGVYNRPRPVPAQMQKAIPKQTIRPNGNIKPQSGGTTYTKHPNYNQSDSENLHSLLGFERTRNLLEINRNFIQSRSGSFKRSQEDECGQYRGYKRFKPENNVELLKDFLRRRGMRQPIFEWINQVPGRYEALVTINQSTYTTYPLYYDSESDAINTIARHALDCMRESERSTIFPLCLDNRDISNKLWNLIRLYEYGLYADAIPDMFIKTYQLTLPAHWYSLLIDAPALFKIHGMGKQIIIIANKPCGSFSQPKELPLPTSAHIRYLRDHNCNCSGDVYCPLKFFSSLNYVGSIADFLTKMEGMNNC